MAKRGSDILAIAKKFIKSIEAGKTGEELGKFYHEKVEHVAYPNALTKNLTKRNLKELREASIKGKSILSKQSYDIIKTYVDGNTVIIEVVWTGTLNIAVGQVPAGGKMKAYFAQFFEFKDGKIIKQRNYDCFEAF